MKKLTLAQTDLLDSLRAQAKAAEASPGAYSRGLSPGTVGCHKSVAASLVRLGLVVEKTAWHGRIVDI